MDFVVRNLQTLLLAGGLLAAGVYALFGFKKDSDEEDAPRVYDRAHGRRSGLAVAAALLVSATVGFVPAGYRGVIYDAGSGVNHYERGEGVSLMVPFWQRLHNVNVRTQVFEYESFVQTKDLQEVTLPLAINYHVDPDAAAQLYQEVGHDYESVIIQPSAFQASTQAAGQIVAADIARSRAELAANITAILQGPLRAHGIVVEFVSVKDAVFDEQFIAQIKANEIAKQKIVESERLVTVAENEANAMVRTATGEAESARIRGDGTADANAAIDSSLTPDVLEWQKLTRWDGVLPSTLLGDSSEVIVNLP